MSIFDTILYNPLFSALIWLYRSVPGHDLGVAIIILTLATKALLAYPSYRAIKSQRELQQIQPKLEALKAKYKDNRQALGQKLMEFYKEHKVNPLSSCLPTLIQLPILIILYRVFISGLTTDAATGLLSADQVSHLYEPLRTIFTTEPLNTVGFGFLQLGATKNIALALITGALQFWQSKMLISQRAPVKTSGARDENLAAGMSRQMTYLFPLFTAYFAYLFPTGLALYWLVSTLFQIGQQYFILRAKPKIITDVSPEKKPDQTAG